MARPKASQLTENELTIMSILWNESPLSVADILERFPRSPKPAYTSLLTNVRTMEDKGYVEHTKDTKAHLYSPVLQPDAYKTSAVGRLVHGLFNGNAAELAINLIKSENLTKSDRAEIRRILETLK